MAATATGASPATATATATATAADREAVEARIEQYAQKLAAPAAGKEETKQKLALAVELRDTVDRLCTGPSVGVFLARMLPVFKQLMTASTTAQDGTTSGAAESDPPAATPLLLPPTPEQKLRNALLETVHRLPLGSPEVAPFAAELVRFCVQLLARETEENGILCLKIILELDRYRSDAIAAEIPPFLDRE
ncbi:hypothetical protein KEM52_003311 [Ascosphaera acerosa]|nr:hypothetical protein KEM52_003311 [Ascosphaera acerosa]